MERRLCLMLICCLASPALYSQVPKTKVDSLNRRLEYATDTERVDIMIDLVLAYYESDSSYRALEMATAARHTAVDIGDSTRAVRAARMEGQLCNQLSMPERALEVLHEARAQVGPRTLDEALILLNIGVAYGEQARFDKALEFAIASLYAHRELGNSRGIEASLQNMGFVYYKLKDYGKALVFFSAGQRPEE